MKLVLLSITPQGNVKKFVGLKNEQPQQKINILAIEEIFRSNLNSFEELFQHYVTQFVTPTYFNDYL